MMNDQYHPYSHSRPLAATGAEATPSLYVARPAERAKGIAPLYVPHTSPRKQKSAILPSQRWKSLEGRHPVCLGGTCEV